MVTDTRILNLIELLSNESNTTDDRVDAAVSLMHADKLLAEKNIVSILIHGAREEFDFKSELLDVLLDEWVDQGKSKEAEALFNTLPRKLRHYAEMAWKNLTNLKE